MSKSLHWTPPPVEQKENYLDLKYEIGRYFDEDYNGGSGEWVGDRNMVPFLLGIEAVGNEGQKTSARELINAILKYGKVCLVIS